MPTRLHRANVVEDVFGGAKTIHTALGRFKKAGRGVLVYLRDGTSGVPTTAIAEETTPAELERSRQWREVGLGAQILRDLRVTLDPAATRPARAPMSGSPGSASRSKFDRGPGGGVGAQARHQGNAATAPGDQLLTGMDGVKDKMVLKETI